MASVENNKNEIEKKEDFLDVDTQIAGQNYVCLSFLSPEKLIKNKDTFIFENFIKDVFDNNELEDIKKLKGSDIIEKFNDFKYTNENKLTREFFEDNECQNCIRGLKVRGVFDTYKEAQIRSKVLQRMDSNFNVFIGQVGYWLPWDPNADDVQDQEYLESELNNLMHEYKKNQDQKDLFFQEQIREKKAAIAEENKNRTDNVVEEEKLSKEMKDSLTEEDPWIKQKNAKII